MTLHVHVVLCSGAEESTTAGSLVLHKSHYLGFGAAGALLHHLKHSRRLALAPRSVQVGAMCWHLDKTTSSSATTKLLPVQARRRVVRQATAVCCCQCGTPPCCLAVPLLC